MYFCYPEFWGKCNGNRRNKLIRGSIFIRSTWNNIFFYKKYFVGPRCAGIMSLLRHSILRQSLPRHLLLRQSLLRLLILRQWPIVFAILALLAIQMQYGTAHSLQLFNWIPILNEKYSGLTLILKYMSTLNQQDKLILNFLWFKIGFYLWFKVDILPLIQNWLLPLIQSWNFTSDSKLTFYLWFKVDILPLIQSWHFTSDSKLIF
jgi:hypothetical protein